MSRELFRLMKLRRKEILKIFRELAAPDVQEMDGEFRATLLDQGKWANNFLTIAAFNLPGVWISKSFSPLGARDGCGYNSFRVGADVRKIYRMKTFIGPSQLDSRPSYHLDYGAVDDQQRLPALTKLAGEIRRFEDSVYLGVGTADFGIARLRREQPFVLEGPVAEFDESVWAA